jgi:hypothetical protein
LRDLPATPGVEERNLLVECCVKEMEGSERIPVAEDAVGLVEKSGSIEDEQMRLRLWTLLPTRKGERSPRKHLAERRVATAMVDRTTTIAFVSFLLLPSDSPTNRRPPKEIWMLVYYFLIVSLFVSYHSGNPVLSRFLELQENVVWCCFPCAFLVSLVDDDLPAGYPLVIELVP